jgi:hypothetical protein
MKQTLLLVLIASLPAAAQWRHFGAERTRLTGGIGFGFTQPVNPLSESLDTGWNVSGGIGVRHGYFGVMVDGMFTSLPINRDLVYWVGADRGRERYFAATVDPVIHVNPRGPVDFYITGGAGLYAVTTSYGYGGFSLFGPGGGFTDSQTAYKGGVNGGCGFVFGSGRPGSVRFFTEARLHHVFTRGYQTNFVPVTVGIRF